LNIAALSAFLTYVGAGLDGQAGMGDFNLQMNDNYQGKVFKGCPTYEQGKGCDSNDVHYPPHVLHIILPTYFITQSGSQVWMALIWRSTKESGMNKSSMTGLSSRQVNYDHVISKQIILLYYA
jgi:hypothetical protein